MDFFSGEESLRDDWNFDSRSIWLSVCSINSNGLTWWESKTWLRVKELESKIA